MRMRDCQKGLIRNIVEEEWMREPVERVGLIRIY